MLNRIYVKGEVSNCKYHTSGHIYFSLKDETGTIACVMFAGSRGWSCLPITGRAKGQSLCWCRMTSMKEMEHISCMRKISFWMEQSFFMKDMSMLKKELAEMGMFCTRSISKPDP